MRQRTIKLYRIEDDGRRLFRRVYSSELTSRSSAALAAVSGDRRAWRLHRQVPRRRAGSGSRPGHGRAHHPCRLSMARKPKIEAVAYLRTSSATNVGRDRDSDRGNERRSRPSPGGRASRLSPSTTMRLSLALMRLKGGRALPPCSSTSTATACAWCWLRTRPGLPAISKCMCWA